MRNQAAGRKASTDVDLRASTRATTELLVLRAVNGNRDAFVQLCERVYPKAVTVASRYMGRDEAPDVVQESVLRAERSLAKLREPSYFNGWFLKIVTRLCMDKLRVRREVTLMGDLPESPVHMSTEAGYAELLKKNLRPEHYAILMLREVDGLSYQELADAFNLPTGTIRSRLHKARVAARNVLAPHLD